jgi:hypothetical protein
MLPEQTRSTQLQRGIRSIRTMLKYIYLYNVCINLVHMNKIYIVKKII